MDADGERGRGRWTGTDIREGAPGRRHLLAGQGRAQDGAAGQVRGPRGEAGQRPRGLALPRAVRRARRRSRPRSLAARRRWRHGYEHRVVPWDEVGEEEGTGIVHIAPGCGAEDYQLGKALGLPVVAPLNEDGHYLRRLRLAEPASMRTPLPSRSSRISNRRATSTTSSRTRTVTRTAGAAARRCCSASSTSGTSRWARSTTSRARASHDRGEGAQPALPDHGRRRPDQVDPGLRLRPRDRLAAHDGRLDDLQEALLGPGAADLGVRFMRPLRRHQRPRRAQAARRGGLGRVRGPHASPAVRGCGEGRVLGVRRRNDAHRRRGQSLAGRGHRAVLDDALPH